MSVGPGSRIKLEGRHEFKRCGRLGPGKSDSKEIAVLNKFLRWTDSGIEYEADPRQCQRLFEGLQFDDGCHGAATPGQKPLPGQIDAEQPLPQNKQLEFRGLAARSKYVSADGADMQFSSKECCWLMASPGMLAMDALKRLGR